MLFIPICQDGIDGRPIVTPGKGDETGDVAVLIIGVVVEDVEDGEDNASATDDPIVELDRRLRRRDFNDLSSCCNSESD